MIKAFFLALGLLTRIPVPSRFYLSNTDDAAQLQGMSVLFYPLIGLLIGAVLLLLHYLFAFLLLPSAMIEAAVLLLVWVLLTGALHLDGLADSADAWLGGYGDRQKTLAIMKDPRSGPAAVVILNVLLLLKFSLLIHVTWPLLLLAPVVGRMAAMLLLATTDNVRKGGMADSISQTLSRPAVYIQSVVLIVIMAIWLKSVALALLPVALLGYTLRAMMIRQINGLTGDTVGAMVEIIEVATLLFFVLFAAI